MFNKNIFPKNNQFIKYGQHGIRQFALRKWRVDAHKIWSLNVLNTNIAISVQTFETTHLSSSHQFPKKVKELSKEFWKIGIGINNIKNLQLKIKINFLIATLNQKKSNTELFYKLSSFDFWEIIAFGDALAFWTTC